MVVDAVGFDERVAGLIDAGAEVHAIGATPLRLRWLASDVACDTDRPTALAAAIERIGPVIHEVYFGVEHAGACRDAVLDAARACTPPGHSLEIHAFA